MSAVPELVSKQHDLNPSHLTTGVMACLCTTLNHLSGPPARYLKRTFPGERLAVTFTWCTACRLRHGPQPGKLLCVRLCSARSLHGGFGLESRLFPQSPHAFACPEHVPAQHASVTINQSATRSALGASEHQGKGFASFLLGSYGFCIDI